MVKCRLANYRSEKMSFGEKSEIQTPPPPVVHASLIFLALLSERLMCTLRISMFQKVAQPLYLENGMYALNDS